MLNFGTFLLMQSPSALPSQEVYARAIEHAQAARDDRLFKLFDRNVAEVNPPCVPEVGVQLTQPRVLKSTELFAREVMPALS